MSEIPHVALVTAEYLCTNWHGPIEPNKKVRDMDWDELMGALDYVLAPEDEGKNILVSDVTWDLDGYYVTFSEAEK